jgi:DNA primase
MGTSITERQILALRKLTNNLNVILALDADEAGKEAVLRCVGYENILETEIKVLLIPAGQDPDDIIRSSEETWQQLLAEALPILDYTFNSITSEIDLSTARGKSSAVKELLPVITKIKNTIRQAHYIQKLARLIKVSEHVITTELSNMKSSSKNRAVNKQYGTAVSHAPREEYCLAITLQHPELNTDDTLKPEYFENSENRELFIAWQKYKDPSVIKQKVDTVIREHLNSLICRDVLSNQIEQKYNDCILNLKVEYYRNLERKREDILALEAKSGGSAAELAKLEEQGIDNSRQLSKAFTEKSRRKPEVKRL